MRDEEHAEKLLHITRPQQTLFVPPDVVRKKQSNAVEPDAPPWIRSCFEDWKSQRARELTVEGRLGLLVVGWIHRTVEIHRGFVLEEAKILLRHRRQTAPPQEEVGLLRVSPFQRLPLQERRRRRSCRRPVTVIAEIDRTLLVHPQGRRMVIRANRNERSTIVVDAQLLTTSTHRALPLSKRRPGPETIKCSERACRPDGATASFFEVEDTFVYRQPSRFQPRSELGFAACLRGITSHIQARKSVERLRAENVTQRIDQERTVGGPAHFHHLPPNLGVCQMLG
ncbi:MAG: hypothetical protein R3F14_27120 [Polyangiaceae bacterium]